jgi:hypothetical protein
MRVLRSSVVRSVGLIFVSSITAATVTFVLTSSSSVASSSYVPPAGLHTVASLTGYSSAGRIVHAPLLSKPYVPNAAQRAEHAKLVALHQRLPAAPVGPHTTEASVTSYAGPATPAPARRPDISPTAFDVLKSSNIPASCPTDCAQSDVNEPDTAASGANIMQTSNWDVAYSSNGGGTWSYQDPYTLSSGFCCDQVVVYQPNRDRFFYEGLDASGFVIGETASSNPTAWCVYQFTATSFGDTSGDLLDYPKISFSNNNLYETWNTYNSSGAWVNTGLARMPLDSLDTCAGFSFNDLSRTDNFTFGLTGPTSSLDTFYWVSNWYTSGSGSGTEERIYSWPENGTSYTYKDITINSYNFSIASCASPDGTITNWCSRLDARYETPWISRAEYRAQANSAFAGDSILGVAIQAGPSSFSDGNDYIVYEYFKLNALTYIGSDQTYSTSNTFAYAGCGVNEEGYTGCIMSYGGGSGDSFPATFLLMMDNVSPTQPWGYDYASTGAGNASAWGDYTVAQPYQPEIGAFIGTGWIENSGGNTKPTVYVWGRGVDKNGYKLWK